MSVFRFEAPPMSSTPISKRMKGKGKDLRKPTFAFSTSPSLLQDITLDKTDVGMRNSVSSGLTMKEYEEQLKKLTAENFNLKLRVYFVEERLSKVTGISDKEDLIKKNIQLKVTCESQVKELEKKQELLFEASKAFELLQKEHAEEVEKLTREKDKEIEDLEEKLSRLESIHNEIKLKFPNIENLNDPDVEIKTFEEYEKQIRDLEVNLRDEEDRYKELEHMLKDNQLELESYKLKCQRMESEIKQRMHRIDELVDELEQKEHVLASANFRIRKLEDDMKSKQREDEIMKERIEEKNKTIESLKNSLASRYDTIEGLENRLAKERSAMQTMQSKLDGFSFQNARLKEELEILQSRLRRTTDVLSPRGKGRSADEDVNKQKYEELLRTMEEQEAQYVKRIKELQEKLSEKDVDAEDYQELCEKHKKLEDDHRRACIALKNFIKRSSEEKKEREALNHMLNSQEEVIADLKAELDEYRNNTMSRLPQDNKDVSSKKESKENFIRKLGKRAIDFEEKMERVSELEAEIIVLNHQIETEKLESSDVKLSSNEFVAKELEVKKSEIEKLNNELKEGRNIDLQEIVNKELSEKNRQIEKLESHLTEMSESNKAQMMALKQEINEKDLQLEMLHNKLKGLEIGSDSLVILECKLSQGAPEETNAESYEKKIWTSNKNEEKNLNLKEFSSCQNINVNGVEQKKLGRGNEDAENVRKEAAKVCSMLLMRLEELSAFLDALLKNGDLFVGDLKKRQDIKEALEKSKELSRQLSKSFTQKGLGDNSLLWNSIESTCSFGLGVGEPLAGTDSLEITMSRDKVISEQTMIINRLREQLKLLNQEIKQRDIELSHCQGDGRKTFDLNDILDFSDQDGIEKQTLSICQELSDFENENNDKLREWMSEENLELPKFQISQWDKCNKGLSFVGNDKSLSKNLQSLETSESEAWSEPDRSVSLARMGMLEDVTLNLSQRNSKGGNLSDSSEETINENQKLSAKRGKSAESEIRRLQSKVKALDECNNYLRLEISLLKNGNVDCDSSSKLQKNEETNLTEKLKRTMEKLDECSLTCKDLEKKLAEALERASASTAQLTEAKNKISALESEINQLNEEINIKKTECEEKNITITELKSKIEEITIESELKIIEAVKHKEAAEKKALEIECRLKDAENISKEVESRVNEIEKQISETKKFKKETVLHFKEAEQQVGTAEKMMEEAEKIKIAAERKTKDFQNFIDLMRKEVEEKMKEAERRIRKSEKEKDELEKQVSKLKKRLLEAEKNKAEVEAKVKEGKETIQCMEEKLKELEVAMDQCNEEAQIKIREIQKKAEAKVKELELKIEEREWVRKTEVERKIAEADKISRELEIGFKRQLEDAEKKVKKAQETADLTIKKIQEDSKKQEAELRQKIADVEAEKKKECSELKKLLDDVRLEASEFELELTRLTNEKIHLEEELKKMLDKESALMRDNKELKGKYENSIHELEDKLTKLTLNKSQLATRLEEIESTNIDLVSRISAIRGKETVMETHEFFSATSPTCSPPFGSPLSGFFGDVDLGSPSELNGNKAYSNQNSGNNNPLEQIGIFPNQGYVTPRRNMNSSPDLGIESDPGRFSSLEANQQNNAHYLGNLESGECDEIKKLEFENAELRRRLLKTRQALEETLTQLSTANQRKKQVEKAICKQLHKTHHILKKARVNFESQDVDPSE